MMEIANTYSNSEEYIEPNIGRLIINDTRWFVYLYLCIFVIYFAMYRFVFSTEILSKIYRSLANEIKVQRRVWNYWYLKDKIPVKSKLIHISRKKSISDCRAWRNVIVSSTVERCSIVIIYARSAITRFYDPLVSQRSR